MRFSFIFAQKDTGRTPSHLWYFGQRCWLLDDLTDFFGYNTKLPLHMGRAERAAIFLTVTDWVLGLGPPADAGSWVLGLQGTLGLGSWGQAPRPVLGVNLAWHVHVVIYNDGEYILVIKCMGFK